MTALLLGAICFIYPDMDGRKLSLLIVFILFLLFAFFIWHVREPESKAGKRIKLLYMPALIFGCAVALRMIWVAQTGASVAPFADFDWAYQAALGSKDYIQQHATFPSWGFYVDVLKLILQTGAPVFTSVQFFNAVINSISVLLVYYLALVVIDEFRTATVAALLLCFMPSNILYTNILSPEFPSMMLLLAAMLLTAVMFRFKLKLPVRILLWVMIGVCCAVADYLKAVGSIFVIAFAVTHIIYMKKHDKPEKRKPNVRTAVMLVLPILLIAMPFYLTGRLIDRCVEEDLGVPINQKVTAHFLFVGLNTKGEGQIHIGDYNHMDLQFLAEHGYDYELTDQWVRDFLKRDWSENYEDIPGLFAKKIQWAWQDDTMPAQYAISQMTVSGAEDSPIREAVNGYGASLSQVYYLALMLFAAVGSAVIRKRHIDNKGAFLLCMYIFGFALLLLISEAQSRYKCMVTPVLCILAATSLTAGIDMVKARISSRKKKSVPVIE